MNQYYFDEMKELLKDDYDKFEKSFNNPMYKSLRVNTLKTNIDFIKESIDVKQQSLFDQDTYYLDEDDKLGNHPYHLAGLYYLQEPSATMAVNALDIKENDWVADLCAAPGGKSSQILSKLNNTGFLLSNEYVKNRALILLSNIERWGSDNYIITNNDTKEIASKFYGCFDKVLVDAPCSGASMFAKYPETINDYNLNSELACQKRQLEILNNAYELLKQNGVLVYSTCTFNKYEDEGAIEKFIEKHPDMQIVDTGLNCGQKGFDKKRLTTRVFPYQGGSGHFVCKMIKTSSCEKAFLKSLPFSSNKIVEQFMNENLINKLNYTIIGSKVYVSSKPLLDVKCNIIRQAVLLGEIVKDRFEPHHHYFVSLLQENNFRQYYDLLDDKELNDYLNGQSLYGKTFKGYVAIRYHGVSIGFGKGDGSQIKNKYPKGLRV